MNKKNPFIAMFNFFKDVKGELRKVVWPTYKDVIRNTTVVLVAVLVIGAIIWVLDFGFSYGRDTLINRSPALNQPVPEADGGGAGGDGAGLPIDVPENIDLDNPDITDAPEIEAAPEDGEGVPEDTSGETDGQ